MNENNEKMPNIELPGSIRDILNRLAAYTYKSYIVGKCVRRLIRGENTQDYEVVTSAVFSRICAIFADYSKLPSYSENERRGEVSITVQGAVAVISPFRAGFTTEGAAVYSSDLTDDLRRRAIAFNAIAYNPDSGFYDPWNGVADLLPKKYRINLIEEVASAASAVSGSDSETAAALAANPSAIFQALGYYASGECEMSEPTGLAVHEGRGFLLAAASEQVRLELSWVLIGKKAADVLLEFSDVFTMFIPELSALKDFGSREGTDALHRAFRAVGFASPLLPLRYAALFSELGRPDCAEVTPAGVKPLCCGYEERSAIYAGRIMSRIGFSRRETEDVCFIIRRQNVNFGQSRAELAHILHEISAPKLRMIAQLRYASARAEAETEQQIKQAEQYKKIVDVINELNIKNTYK